MVGAKLLMKSGSSKDMVLALNAYLLFETTSIATPGHRINDYPPRGAWQESILGALDPFEHISCSDSLKFWISVSFCWFFVSQSYLVK